MEDYYQADFSVFFLENDGTYNEMDVQQENLGDSLHEEEVLLLIRQDLRRLFIWKGPKSPVRKRFISSRVASKLQEDIRKNTGRHLKIVSVDAGDETVEFLAAFDLEPFEVTGQLQELRYIRNADKEKMKQEAYKKKLEAKKKSKTQEYTSPLMQEANENGMQVDNASSAPAPKPKPRAPTPKPKMKYQAKSDSFGSSQKSYSSGDVKSIINEVIGKEPPKGLSRMNIIIGQNLYAPAKIKSVVLGQEIEKTEWNAIQEFPSNMIDLDMKKIRVFIDEKSHTVKAIDLYQVENGKSTKAKSKKTTSKKTTGKSKRSLPKIPGTE